MRNLMFSAHGRSKAEIRAFFELAISRGAKMYDYVDGMKRTYFADGMCMERDVWQGLGCAGVFEGRTMFFLSRDSELVMPYKRAMQEVISWEAPDGT